MVLRADWRLSAAWELDYEKGATGVRSDPNPPTSISQLLDPSIASLYVTILSISNISKTYPHSFR